MAIKIIEYRNDFEIRKIVDQKNTVLCYQVVPKDYDGKDISKVFNLHTLDAARELVGYDYVGDAMSKTIGKKPMREYEQNKKGYRADNRK